MIAALNNLVAGAVVALAAHLVAASLAGGIVAVIGVALTVALTAYQRWRFADFDEASRRVGDPAPAAFCPED